MLEIDGMNFRYWIVLFTASCWANMIGLNISSGFNSVVTIYILVPMILVPQLLFSGVVVDFTKMHNKVARDKQVPLIGEAMASRWAYEAIAVTQFRDNLFERNFYESEKKASNASYYRSYAIPGLKEIASDSKDLFINNSDSFRYRNNLLVLQSELKRICRDTRIPEPSFLDSISLKLYNPSLNSSITNFLNTATRVYINRYNSAVAERDGIYTQLVESLGGADQFLAFRQKYYNKQLADLLTNDKEINNYSVHDGEMVPVKDAIFRDPSGESWRSHFYSPVKIFFNNKVNSYWFDLAVIWLFSALLFVLLYYDVVRRLLTYAETLRLNRLNKLRINRLLKITEQNPLWHARKPVK